MEKSVNNRGIVTVIVMTLVIISIIMIKNYDLHKDIETLEGGWEFSINNVKTERQPGDTLSNFIFPTIKKGDILRLTKNIGKPDLKHPTIEFYTWHSIVNVFLDGKKIYTDGEELFKEDRMVGLAHHTVILDGDFKDKDLTIEMIATEDASMPFLESVSIYSPEDGENFWFNRPLLTMFIGMFFMNISIIMFIYAIRVLSSRDIVRRVYMMSFTFSVASWYILSRIYFTNLVIKDRIFRNQVEYISLYTLLIPFAIYVWYVASDYKSKIKNIYKKYIIIDIINIIVVYILGIFNFIHLNRFMPFERVFSVILVVITIALFIDIDRNNKEVEEEFNSYKKGVYSIAVGVLLTSIMSAIMYSPYYGSVFKVAQWYDYLIPVLMMVAFGFFLDGFFIKFRIYEKNIYERMMFKRMAYTDALTDIGNRLAFRRYAKLQISKGGDFKIISIDLNDFKVINDTYGHDMGDEVLKKFAKIITAFDEKDAIGFRIGGDEFLIVVSDSYTVDIVIKKINDAVNSVNKEQDKYIMSFSYGYAGLKEAGSLDNMMKLADVRMYHHKNVYKKNKGEKFVPYLNEN